MPKRGSAALYSIRFRHKHQGLYGKPYWQGELKAIHITVSINSVIGEAVKDEV